MFQNFILKQMLKKNMKSIPIEQQEKVFSMIEKNPNFFMEIAEKVQEKVRGGMPQQEAMMQVIQSHQDELKKLI